MLYNAPPLHSTSIYKNLLSRAPKLLLATLEGVSIWAFSEMSMPLDQLQQPPPSLSYTRYSRHGSVGPVIAVLAVIAILGTLAAIVGRLCSGRRIMGHGQYDIESWLEEKCSSCIDGRVNPPPLPSADISAGSVPLSIPIHTQEETKPDEPSSQNPRPKGGS